MRKFFLIAGALFFFIVSCTKIDTTTLGAGLIPPVDGVTTLDTLLDVYTNTRFDSLGLTAKVYRSDDHVIGTITNDPIFGNTVAEAYFELKPTGYKYYFPGYRLVADSAVLILSYRGCFGDSTIPQTWEVYEVTEKMDKDSVYGVGKTFTTAGTPLGRGTVYIDSLRKPVKTTFETATNQIRIKLDTFFAKRLIVDYDSTAGGAYESDSLFRDRFKGFAVRPANGSAGNALVRVNFLDSNTKVGLYYRFKVTDTSRSYTSAVNYFRFSSGAYTPLSSSANHITRTHAVGSIAFSFTSNANESDVYVHTNPGTFATISIPGLANFPNAVIHRAELLAIQAPDVDPVGTKFSVPSLLFLSRYDSVNHIKRNVPNDFVVSSGSFSFAISGGFPIDRAVNNGVVKSYNFDLSRYVQGIVTRKDSLFTFRLSAPSTDSMLYVPPYPFNTSTSKYYITPSGDGNPIGTGRVVLGGGARAAADPYRMRLRIVYSKL